LFSEQLGVMFSGGGASKLPWMLLLLFGSISWSGGSLFSKHRPTSGSGSVSAAWQMLTAGIVYVPVSVIHGEFSNLNVDSIHTSSWLAVTYLVFFGSIAAYSAYVWLLQVRPATQVSTYAYVNPVIAVILGVVFIHENISFIQLAGLFVILGSVLLINLAKYRKERQVKELAGV
ncbi:MAG: EamA family transporter, partial [Mucilaginibacter sp.]